MIRESFDSRLYVLYIQVTTTIIPEIVTRIYLTNGIGIVDKSHCFIAAQTVDVIDNVLSFSVFTLNCDVTLTLSLPVLSPGVFPHQIRVA